MDVRRIAVFDSATAAYTQAFQTFLAHTDQKDQAMQWLANEVQALPRRGVAIDAGAGTGKLTAWLLEHFGRVIGVEPNPTLADAFRATCPGTPLLQQTILDAQPEAAADFVLCSHVFYYLPRETWEDNLLRLISWLAPGGVLAITIQNGQTDCMRMLDHFLGGRFPLGTLAEAAQLAPGGPYQVRLDTVPAWIRTDDLPTACAIAEFMLNLLPIENPPEWAALEAYVAEHFAQPGGGYAFSCHQDFLRVEKPAQA